MAMVRINLINPRYLADQHLIAEYNEILMLVSHTRKHPPKSKTKIPQNYVLGRGHINFFKNKLGYLKKRHEELKTEMKKRGFRVNKTVDLSGIRKELHQNYIPLKQDLEIIKKRIAWKIKKKPDWYRYYHENKGRKFLLELLNQA